jgi:hypothetical protein
MLDDLHNIASGRCFILGSGPSLLDEQALPRLANETTIAVDSLAGWHELPFTPTYHILGDVNPREAMQWDREDWDSEKFNIWYQDPALGHFRFVQRAPDHEGVFPYGMVGFDDTLPPIRSGRMSPLTVLQLGVWMGYREFYLLGCDMSSRGHCYNPDEHRVCELKWSHRVQRNAVPIAQTLDGNGGSLTDCTLGGFLNITWGHNFTNKFSRYEHGYGNAAHWKEILPYKPLAEVLNA